MELVNIVRSAFDPKKLPVMAKKMWKRFFDRQDKQEQEQNIAWIKENCSNFEKWASEINNDLWLEATQYSECLKTEGRAKLAKTEYPMGGGGCYPVLYFVTRHMKPKTVIETGVAAGFSSSAFLAAIKENGMGRLYSSDFPYFRIANPEKFIGMIVEDELKQNWELFIKGDEKNIPAILERVDEVELFHYDSDKSYSGRTFAIGLIGKKMSSNGIMIIDDIQDNSHFQDYIANNNINDWHVFEFEGKYLGVIGSLNNQ